MKITIRRLGDDDIQAAMHTFTAAMQFAPLTGDAWERAKGRTYPERSFGAFDGTAMVGHTRTYPFRTLVPGGAMLATGGVTAVGTLPTHRRRGIISRLMLRQLEDCVERDEPLASLRASEATIYGRFGYGMAGHALHVEVDTRRGFAERVEDDGAFRFVRGPELIDLLPPLQERCVRRPGEMTRPLPLWRRSLGDLLKDEQSEASYVVVHEDRRGRPDGYVEWASKWDQESLERVLTADLGDLMGVNDHVEALMWQFLLDLDLITRIVGDRPVDDAVRWRLVDPRAYATKQMWDEQWLRIVQVETALAARTYNDAPGAVVLDVTDPLLPDNDGRYEISTAGSRQVRRAADLEVPIRALGAIYLGGTSVAELVAAGLINERKRGAAKRADVLLHSSPAPFCGTFF